MGKIQVFGTVVRRLRVSWRGGEIWLEETEVAPLLANELTVGVNKFDAQSVSTVKEGEVHQGQQMPHLNWNER